MSKLRVSAFSVSIDGYGAGPHQSLEAPLGVGGEGLHAWIVSTPFFQSTHGDIATDLIGDKAARTGVDDDLARRSMENLGAWIMGRNMFGPMRGPWTDESWKGWWGANPPYHVPVYVLSHHARPSITMEGGTVFHFITDGIHAALERALEAAKGKDVRLGGGASTIRQYLTAGLIDELHLAISPVLLGTARHAFGTLTIPRVKTRCPYVGELFPGFPVIRPREADGWSCHNLPLSAARRGQATRDNRAGRVVGQNAFGTSSSGRVSMYGLNPAVMGHHAMS